MCGLGDATSEEFDPAANCNVIFSPDVCADKNNAIKRGASVSELKKGTKIFDIYNNEEKISERHWHKFEVNPKYYDALEKNGLVISGKAENGGFADAVEVAGHKFFVGVIFHPQFKSRPNRPHKLIKEFVGACLK